VIDNLTQRNQVEAHGADSTMTNGNDKQFARGVYQYQCMAIDRTVLCRPIIRLDFIHHKEVTAVQVYMFMKSSEGL